MRRVFELEPKTNSKRINRRVRRKRQRLTSNGLIETAPAAGFRPLLAAVSRRGASDKDLTSFVHDLELVRLPESDQWFGRDTAKWVQEAVPKGVLCATGFHRLA